MDVLVLADRFRAAVEDTGLLLIHDQELPSATAIAAGGPFGGSWWSHPLAHPIYDALQLIEDDVTRAKLVKGKVTLIAPRLWPALAAVGAGRRPWQMDGLTSEAIDLLRAVDGAGVPMRAPSGAMTKAVGVLEQRLLVRTDEVHTESGRHAKVLQSWRAWATDLGLGVQGRTPMLPSRPSRARPPVGPRSRAVGSPGPDVCERSRPHAGNRPQTSSAYAADLSRMWTPQAEPRPMTWARPTLAPSIWRSPASPRR